MSSAKHDPVAKSEMVIRRPVGEVFNAIVDPAVTTKFWFSNQAANSNRASACAGTGRCMALARTST